MSAQDLQMRLECLAIVGMVLVAVVTEAKLGFGILYQIRGVN